MRIVIVLFLLVFSQFVHAKRCVDLQHVFAVNCNSGKCSESVAGIDKSVGEYCEKHSITIEQNKEWLKKVAESYIKIAYNGNFVDGVYRADISIPEVFFKVLENTDDFLNLAITSSCCVDQPMVASADISKLSLDDSLKYIHNKRLNKVGKPLFLKYDGKYSQVVTEINEIQLARENKEVNRMLKISGVLLLAITPILFVLL